MKAKFFSSWAPPGVRETRAVSPGHVAAVPRWVFLGILLVGLTPAGPLFAYNLYLEQQVQVPAGPIRLGDIARIEGEQEVGRVAGKLLFRDLKAPRYIGASALRESLGQGGPENLDRIYGAGVWVIPLGRELTAADLEKLLREQIAGLPGGAELYTGSVLRLPENTRLRVPEEGVRLVFRLPTRAVSLTPGKRIIPLDVLPVTSERPNTVLARHQLQLSILEKRSVAVATRDLPLGHRLTAGDYRIETREMDSDEIRFAQGNLVNHRVMADVKSGTDLTTSNVQMMPAVRRGQSLTLVYQRPGLVFRVRSVALENGEVGQTIPVRVLFPASGNRKSAETRQLKVTVINETTAVFENGASQKSTENTGDPNHPVSTPQNVSQK